MLDLIGKTVMDLSGASSHMLGAALRPHLCQDWELVPQGQSAAPVHRHVRCPATLLQSILRVRNAQG